MNEIEIAALKEKSDQQKVEYVTDYLSKRGEVTVKNLAEMLEFFKLSDNGEYSRHRADLIKLYFHNYDFETLRQAVPLLPTYLDQLELIKIGIRNKKDFGIADLPKFFEILVKGRTILRRQLMEIC